MHTVDDSTCSESMCRSHILALFNRKYVHYHLLFLPLSLSPSFHLAHINLNTLNTEHINEDWDVRNPSSPFVSVKSEGKTKLKI